MRNSISGLRLGVVLLFMLGLLAPALTTGAAAQELTCDDFNSQRAAQAVLDADPDTAETLDEDGDGIACNELLEDEDATEEATDEDATEEADSTEEADATEEDDSNTGDADEYLADVQAQLDDFTDSSERFDEILATIGDADEADQADMAEEIEEIATTWSEYPDVAADLEAPSDAADVEDVYLDFADAVGESGTTFLDWLAIPSGDPDEDAAWDDHLAAYDEAQSLATDLQDALDDAGTGGGDATAEATEDDNGGDSEGYFADVQAELDTYLEDSDRFNEILTTIGDADEADQADMAAELEEIATGWTQYADTAADLGDAPEGGEDVQVAYEDFADAVTAEGEAFLEWLSIPSGDPDEADAEDAWTAATDDAQAAASDLQDALDEVSGGEVNTGALVEIRTFHRAA
jgi:hypothetical protein